MTDARRRRGVVLAVAALVVLAVGLWAWAGWGPPPDPDGARPAGAAVRAYFGDGLRDGSKLERWTLVRVHDVRLGTIPVVMATAEGARFQVDLLARDPTGPRSVADTTQLSLFVVNAGDGGTTTVEEQRLGALALAAALTTRENAGATPPPLSSLQSRAAASAERRYHVPLD